MKKILLSGVSLVFCCLSVMAQSRIDLSGEWQFSMGEKPEYNDKITLPGSMLTNGKGNEVSVNTQWTGSLYDSSFYFNPYMAKYRHEGQMKFPFFLTPSKHYVGAAWYRKTVAVPSKWKKQTVTLVLERPHIETTVYVNGKEVGHEMSLSVPHVYDVTPYLIFGRDNEIAIRVYNGIENVGVGQDSHSVTDQTQGNWNGIAGNIELTTEPQVKRIRVVPNMSAKSVVVSINEQSYTIDLSKNWRPWSEFDPYLYTLTFKYHGKPVTVTFGVREISIRDMQFYLNGKPIWMRGTVENCTFPLTGYPPTDEESWEHVFGKCREYGINHVRFHSYCPPEAAFAVADRMGIYLQPEGPSWPNHGVRLRRGMPIDKYLLEETKRIIDTYGHHPSFVMMAAGNEPAGDWVNYCNDWVKQMKAYDPTKVYAGASVGGGWAWDDGSEYHVKAGARGLDWDRRAPSSDDNYYEGILHPRNFKGDVNNSPVIAHEQGQWCAFPDFKEIPQYTGAYKAANFEIFRDLLNDNGMASQAERFLKASGHLQMLCYKYEIERNLRTKDYAGFQILGLNDYSGQGTALEGVLNVFWREKGYCNAADWTQFCSPVVPLAKFPKFVFTSDEKLTLPFELYNTLGELYDVKMECKIESSVDNSHFTLLNFQLDYIPVGKIFDLGQIECEFSSVTVPQKQTITVALVHNGQQIASNHWDYWVYPAQMSAADESQVYISDSLDAEAIKTLERGGKVLITAAGKVRLGNDVHQTYLPVFWNTSWFKMRPPHTTGAYINTAHPLFREFPSDDWSNLNWWELLNRAQVMNLMELPMSYQSPVQPIDTWHVSRKLGMIVEANVLSGRLFMTTIDINSNLDRRVVARQMRKAIFDYINDDAAFRPEITLSLETVRDFFEKEAPKVNMFTNDSPDELKPALKP